MTRTQLYLPQTQYQELKLLAAQRGKTFASLAREFLEEKVDELKRQKRKKTASNNIGRWLVAIKNLDKFKENGRRDGSTRHDEVLYGRK